MLHILVAEYNIAELPVTLIYPQQKSSVGQKNSLLESAEPLSAGLLGIFWLNISFSAMDWLGDLLIISTIILLGLKKSAV